MSEICKVCKIEKPNCWICYIIQWVVDERKEKVVNMYYPTTNNNRVD